MHFFCKLVPPRPTFALDMSPDERRLLEEHVVYWRAGLAAGSVLIFGLVGDPEGAYGIGVIDFPTEAEARTFTDGDPTIRSGQGFHFAVAPMPYGAVTR